MPTKLNGTTGVDKVQDGSVSAAALAAGAVVAGKLSGVQTGSAPLYGMRAWAVFNGTTTGTNPPLAGGNVASIQRVSAGQYAVVFTTAMPTANYAITVISRNNPSATTAYAINGAPTVNGFQFLVLTGPGVASDSDYVTITITC